ncbi:MAG: tail fiber domain-containing protein [Bacteroidota bacterium]|nr:tail fiber domain-containing protein [Bacteroidota bacterium]
MKGQTYLIGLVALGVTWRLAAQHVGIGTNAPAARLHVQTPSTDDFIRTGWFQNQRDAADNNGVLIDIARAAADAYALNVRSGVGAGLTSRLYVRGDGNVGIGTTAPEARLHVNGRAIVHDGTTGTPTNSTWGSAGSRIILWPGSATTTPYQIGIAPGEMWIGVHQAASWSVFRGTHRQLIVRPTSPLCHVGSNYNFPSIMLGNLTGAYSSGPYPKRGTFVYFGGPTDDFQDNSDPALMYFVHLASDVTRLRLHVEDNVAGPDQDGFSILGASCGGGGCYNLAASSLLFDFVSNGEAYKPGGGSWAAISDARLKEDIHPYTRGLAELRALRPVRYKYKKEYWAASDRYFTGLIAQEVQDVVPEMVHPYKFQAIGDKLIDVLAVDPSDLTYMLINAVKELDAENQQLKARLAALEAEKDALAHRLSLIESRLAAIEGLKGSK